MLLTHLRYFEAIARSGSFTAAARELGVTQPALTAAIRRLEQRFATTLLLRDSRGATPTHSGEALLRAAREVLATVTRAERDLRALETEEIGRFVIGCHESLGAYFLPRFLVDFLRAAPKIEITLWNGTSANVVDAVLSGIVDFGLSVNPRPHPDLVMTELFRDAVDIFFRPDDDARPSLPDARDLLRRGPLIYAPRVAQCQEIIERLAAEELLPPRTLQTGDLELTKSLALGGLGIALLPRRVARYGHEGKLLRLHPSLPFVSDTIRLVYRADAHKTRAMRRVKDALLAAGRAMGPSE